ncbi:hypothetical protein KUCAC02_006791, partial [Chaenocephalus aceratus]
LLPADLCSFASGPGLHPEVRPVMDMLADTDSDQRGSQAAGEITEGAPCVSLSSRSVQNPFKAFIRVKQCAPSVREQGVGITLSLLQE